MDLANARTVPGRANPDSPECVWIVGERCHELPTPPGAQYAESALGSAGPA